MAGQVRVLRRRIRTTRSTKKITKAMELVATSRIAKAQERVQASRPYASAITDVLTALASNANTAFSRTACPSQRPTGAQVNEYDYDASRTDDLLERRGLTRRDLVKL